jgi:hypothetical protein
MRGGGVRYGQAPRVGDVSKGLRTFIGAPSIHGKEKRACRQSLGFMENPF